jgi:signal transduction histidine kinase
VLSNLVANGIKFTQQGQVTIRAGGTWHDKKFALAVSVIDSGIGIDAATQARLFNAFVQADGSVTRQYGGTGLGLAICKRLIELMGGQISVTSTPNQGAEFRFEVLLAAG